MASFALVRFKCNSQIVAVSVKEMLALRKENGVRKFEPYIPICVTDFKVSSRHKYAVLLTDSFGNLRRWYVMIGRLGASPEEVLYQAGSVEWPAVKTRKSQRSCFSQLTDMTIEHTINVSAAAAHDHELQVKSASLGHCGKSEKANKHIDYQEVQPKSHQTNQEEKDMFDTMMNRLNEVYGKIVERFDGVEQSLLDLPDQIKRSCMTNVSAWLNSIPENLPEIRGASDVRVDQVKDMKKSEIAVGDTASGNESVANYVDAKSVGNESKMKVDERVETDESESESEVTSQIDSDFPDKDIFYSFLSGIVSEN
ncbi:hypothetical protein FOCC_FOCC005228 [Frankliniella occidentalis]|uniref:Uncharacterized protein LOC113213006 isoform X1 n=2 Tax=Frankliniella occidentalis TaxID=133901 RepID=A0A9C6U3J2_FRAOC|nr:uncharacterized protein LOC113213006 isoform X1 [Frankliniella occidentalis]KAE8748033.1 hypothetical protein FOCC_FOCC005228 [Frankliniella occidentalis]